MGTERSAFSSNLAFHRERLGLTQAQLAEVVDTSSSYIGHLERGDREPSLLMIEELAKALGLHVGELFVTRTGQGRSTVRLELQQLLLDRSDDDVMLVVRLARAAFEDPRLDAGASSESIRSHKARRGKR